MKVVPKMLAPFYEIHEITPEGAEPNERTHTADQGEERKKIKVK